MSSSTAEDIDVDSSAPWYIWVFLTLIAFISFWCQATVTEERFVPALNVISTYYNIPDDVAGATLMAAGASSPELFSSIVALFVTHSALGLGTIVGSEIFNQLIICAGAVWSSKNSGGFLQLDRAIVVREVGYYALSIVLLFIALHDQEPSLDDDETGHDHIFITFGDASLLVLGYISYVLVCANFEWVVKCCSKYCCFGGGTKQRQDSADSDDSTSEAGPGRGRGFLSSTKSKRADLTLPAMPFLKYTTAFESEPASNFESFHMTRDGDKRRNEDEKEEESITLNESTRLMLLRQYPSSSLTTSGIGSSSRRRTSSLLERSLCYSLSQFSDGESVRTFTFYMEQEKPSEQHEYYDLEVNSLRDTTSCFLWQRSYFYNKSKFALHGWNLRWFTFGTQSGIVSVPDRAGDYGKYQITYPIFHQVEVDEERLILRIVGNKRSYYLMAPDKAVLDAVVKKCEDIMEAREQQTSEDVFENLQSSSTRSIKGGFDEKDGGKNDDDEAMDNDDYESHGSLIAFPHGGSNLEIAFHVFLFPIKCLMHITIPDVRCLLDPQGEPVSNVVTWAYVAILSCLLWLIIGSYAMVASLEALADLMNIPDAVVGVTVSAAGTSLPNYVASKVAAERGFGGMAVSNAFGSNTFNIMVGLGFPWLLYTSFGTNFQPYHKLRNDGILESVVVMLGILLVFVIIVMLSNFRLYKWHGTLFVFLYVGYLAFAIIPVYM